MQVTLTVFLMVEESYKTITNRLLLKGYTLCPGNSDGSMIGKQDLLMKEASSVLSLNISKEMNVSDLDSWLYQATEDLDDIFESNNIPYYGYIIGNDQSSLYSQGHLPSVTSSNFLDSGHPYR